MSQRDTLTQLIRTATDQGWTVVRIGHGLKWTCPTCHRKTFSACTPSGHRAVRNVLAELRRHGLAYGGRPATHREQ